MSVFQSTQPEWAATFPAGWLDCRGCHFNPRSPSGLRLTMQGIALNVNTISIHAARVGCDNKLNKTDSKLLAISIHAARVGCDDVKHSGQHRPAISIHAARVGCDYRWLLSVTYRIKFQSTQPEWAATLCGPWGPAAR